MDDTTNIIKKTQGGAESWIFRNPEIGDRGGRVLDFIALDVETANADLASICQIGIAAFQSGDVVDTWSSLVNPQDYFDPMNMSVHGISPEDVEDAPLFADTFQLLKQTFTEQVVIHHMPFDKIAVNRACDKWELPTIETRWLDSARVVRRTWTEYARKGYGLANMAKVLGIEFKHHDALGDAVAAGKIMVRAIQKSGIPLSDWSARAFNSITQKPLSASGNPEGPLHGETVVFTGSLVMPRREISEMAATAGCDVSSSVTGKTTMLVVGVQDLRRTQGQEKSSKHRKAESLISSGASIAILSEEDFFALIAYS